MQIILTEDVPKLGKAGAVVKVKDGYARNFLIPRKLCILSTAAQLEKIESRKRQEQRKHTAAKEQALALAKKIGTVSCTIKMQAGEQDRLFGAVTTLNIQEALNQLGIHIDKKYIVIEEPIRKLGQAQAKISLHPEVEATLKVWVVKQ